ncbi:MAG: hypothetical protein JF606_18455 [Burkholderiales bacterium]|jgi:hypothetical protein|nr:hypothetical protein [Burkholderiales bacterium]
MIPPVSHPSAHELKEIHAIAIEAAHDALFVGWSTSNFHGYQIHAHSWCEADGTRLRVIVFDRDASRALAVEQLHAPLWLSCDRGSESQAGTPDWGSVSIDDLRTSDVMELRIFGELIVQERCS